jgi:Holliday junction resolvase-like predicted endonuclease
MRDLKPSTKRIGYLGEQYVVSHLLKQGYDVYYPAVDDNGVDLIVETDTKLKRVQVKTIRRIRGTTIEINTSKYINRGIDVIAIYLELKSIIAYYPFQNEERIILAVHQAKNNQEKGRNWFYRYMEFPS